jgi:hypothetical protein
VPIRQLEEGIVGFDRGVCDLLWLRAGGGGRGGGRGAVGEREGEDNWRGVFLVVRILLVG